MGLNQGKSLQIPRARIVSKTYSENSLAKIY